MEYYDGETLEEAVMYMEEHPDFCGGRVWGRDDLAEALDIPVEEVTEELRWEAVVKTGHLYLKGESWWDYMKRTMTAEAEPEVPEKLEDAAQAS